MFKTRSLTAIVLLVLVGSFYSCEKPLESDPLAWPEITNETQPWTRWWWHGNAVTKEGITSELEALKGIGIGGVELTPIFGIIGKEEQFIDYLSPEWMEMFMHTLTEAQRLGLGVDMATGTGWPFGGPWIGADHAPKNMVSKKFELHGGEKLREPVQYTQKPLVRSVTNMVYQLYGIYRVPGEEITGSMKEPQFLEQRPRLNISDIDEPISSNANLQALALDQVRFEKELPLVTLMAYSDEGQVVDLTKRVAGDGLLDWVAPEGSWELVALFQGWHGKMVERAAPGGEGNTLDHFSEVAISTYLARFDSAFADADIGYLRAFFNDSYEVDDARGEADWTPELLDEFERRRGYDLRHYLRELLSGSDDEMSRRVLSDYRETIGELLLEKFTNNWDQWAEAQGALIRSQAHGSPGNLLDLYAASDIPETEGTDPIASQFASSAAHVSGKRLSSSEAATWLDEHFLSSLADIRANVERYLLSGINHVFYHGTAYSPDDEPWPGYLFYAAIHANDRNTWWQDFGQLNQYIARVQSFLQAGKPANEVLVYFPIHDLYATPGHERLVHFDLGRGAFEESSADVVATWLRENGYSFDFISDAQLLTAAGSSSITTAGGDYRVLFVPACEYMPISTLQKILELARAGTTVIFEGGLPQGPPGMKDLENRQARFDQLVGDLQKAESVTTTNDIAEALASQSGVRREPMVDLGLQWIKRDTGEGSYYFVVNQSDTPIDGYVPLSAPAESAVIFDPETGINGVAETRSADVGIDVYLQLAPGESLIVGTHDYTISGTSFPYFEERGEPTVLSRPWEVAFLRGGPTLPEPVTDRDLLPWTSLDNEDVSEFSGTASYRTTFDRPAGDVWKLDLGTVKESARVFVNGKEVGILIGPEYSLILAAADLTPTNTLEIQVTNLMANRIADMDKKGVFWKKFYNINFPARLAANRTAGLFDASEWEPMESGLIGPVTLTALEEVSF